MLRTATTAGVLLLLATVVAAQTAGEPREPRRSALLIGCSDYPGLRDHLIRSRGARGRRYYERKVRLLGPPNDVELVARTLSRHLGFPSSRIRTLVGWPDRAVDRPTRANILAELDRLEKTSAHGDLVVVFFAGHGSRVIDVDGDEYDGLDEVLVPADAGPGEDGKRFAGTLSDDEFGARLRAIRDRGARVRVVLDCCHSGTATRGSATGRTRQVDGAALGLEAPPSPRTADAAVLDSRAGVDADDHRGIAAMYAVGAHQRALEIELPRETQDGRRPQGVFTFNLCRVLAEVAAGGRDPGLREIEARLLEAYETQPFADLQPIFDGGDLDATFIGGAAPRPRPLLLTATGSGLSIDGGVLEGVEKGALLECELPGVGPQRLEVVGSRGLESECRFLSDAPGLAAAVPRAGIEVRIARRALETRLALFLSDVRKSTALRELIAGYPSRWREAKSVDEADWIVSMHDAAYRFEAVGSRGARAFEFEEDDLGDALRRIGRFDATLRVADRWAARLPEGVLVRAVRIAPDGVEDDIGPRHPLRPGDRIQIYVANRARRPIDLNVLLFGANFAISTIWPRRGETSVLTPEDAKPIPLWKSPPRIDDASFGIEHLLVVAAPTEGMTTRLGRRLDELRQPGFSASRAGKDPVAEFLVRIINEDATRGSPRELPSFGMKVIAIRTAWSRLRAPRRPAAAIATDDVGGVAAQLDLLGISGVAAPGPAALWSRPDADSAPDVLITGEATSEGEWKRGGRWTAYVDVDRDSVFADPAAPGDGDAAGLDVEIVLVVEPDGRRVAGYDSDGSGAIDLVVVDDDDDPDADVRFVRTADGWQRVDVEGPWLWTQHLRMLRVGAKDRAYRERRALRRRTTDRLRALFP